MSPIPANRARHPFIHGVSNSANPHYRKILGQLRDALRDISRPNMTVGDYRRSCALLISLTGDEGEHVAPRDPRMHTKVVRAYNECRRKLLRSAQPRLRDVCEQATLNLWHERNPGRTPDTRLCAFTLTHFNSYWEPVIQDELAILIPQLTLSPRDNGRPLHRLILGPVWLHELLTGTWTRTDSSWHALATDVPDGEPVLGLGVRALCEDTSASEMLAALWNDDPLTEYFAPANVLEAAQLL
jgi:hypothetical protein